VNKNNPLAIGEIKSFFPFHRICLVKTLLLLVNCILVSNSCNLNKAKKKGSIVLGKVTKPENVYKRFIRFFNMKGIEGFTIGVLQLVLHLIDSHLGEQHHYCFAIDRTNWQLGRVNINILFIGYVLENGCFIPLYFSLLNKKGNSSQLERISLFKELDWFFKQFTHINIVVVGDREFIGIDWFCYLSNCHFDFVLRTRRKDYLKIIAKEYGWSVKKLEIKIRRSIRKRGYFVLPVTINGKTFYYHVSEKKASDNLERTDPYIRFMSTSIDTLWVKQQYEKRWKIEVFFEDCKLKGFDMESINFKEPGKIRLMVAICSLCYILCIMEGEIQYRKKEPSLKIDKKTNKVYKRVSYFTKGYEMIEQIIINIGQLANYITQKLKSQIPINNEIIQKRMYLF